MLITVLPGKTNTTVQILPIVTLQWNYSGFTPAYRCTPVERKKLLIINWLSLK